MVINNDNIYTGMSLRLLVLLTTVVGVVDGFQSLSLAGGSGRHAKSTTHQFFTTTTLSATVPANNNNDDNDENDHSNLYGRRSIILQSSMAALLGSSSSLLMLLLQQPEPASARLEAVDRPDLLPKDTNIMNVIQTEKFLTTGQARRINDMLTSLEKETGFRVRVLCQQYPNTPGLAIRDYWSLGKEDQKDDKYVVLVVDNFNGRGNALNFNVGDGVKFALPNVFWTRLSGKYGTTFFIKENGMDVAIENAVEAIVSCLRNEDGYCTAPPEQGQSMRSLGLR